MSGGGTIGRTVEGTAGAARAVVEDGVRLGVGVDRAFEFHAFLVDQEVEGVLAAEKLVLKMIAPGEGTHR